MATIFKNYEEDATPGDEQDPAYKEEIFRLFQSRGTKPSDLIDKAYAEEYKQWLAENA